MMLLFICACKEIPSEKGEIKIYFCPEDNCEQAIINTINNDSEVLCAFYDLNLKNLTSSLKKARAEVLIFKENFEGYGIPINSKGLMHNKFCIINAEKIITGSFNPTFNGNYLNNNNLLIIKSKNLAKNYLAEIKELRKGMQKKTSEKNILLNDKLVENYFCPEDNCKKEVLKKLRYAKKSVYFMTFSFTDKEIAKLLVEKNQKINIVGIMERKRTNMKYNVFHYLNNSGVEVMQDNNPGTMHHKAFIIDEEIVITGSYNPTKNGNEKNDENILIIHDSNIAKIYLEEFYKIKNY
jgi:phosphatidylserine/phosphatidylglycerophosphate/cardiolipin synthase-like enzyme|tara:strand:- start:1608 stop:2492 length:885 start_codon:yes stop_codon:yes gene_type:complete